MIPESISYGGKIDWARELDVDFMRPTRRETTTNEIRLALRRVGITPISYRDPGDWIGEDPPTWEWWS